MSGGLADLAEPLSVTQTRPADYHVGCRYFRLDPF